MSRKTVVEEAVIQMKNLEDALKENAKGILASTMKQEINSLVKESLKEQDEVETDDEEEVAIAGPEGEEEDIEVDDEETFDVDDEDDDVEDDDITMDDEEFEMDDEEMPADDEEEAIDLRGASDEDVAVVFSKMNKNDKISIEKMGDYYDLKDLENDTEYIIKLNESDEEYFEDDFMYEKPMFKKGHRHDFENEFEDDFEGDFESDFEGDFEDDFEGDFEGNMYDEKPILRRGNKHSFDSDFMSNDNEEVVYELEMNEDSEYDEGTMTYENMDEELDEMYMDEELDEMYMDEELDEMYMDEESMSFEDLEESEENWDDLKPMNMSRYKEAVQESKQKTGSASKFKYSKKPNLEGFNTKMKEGSKRYGKSGKANFDYDNEDPNSEIVMKIVNKIKKGKKSETKEASRTLGVGKKFGKNGLDKKITAPRHLQEEVEILREKNDEYRKALDLFRTKLNEVAVFNSNLAYATRLFTEHSTTKQEKINILRRFDNVESLKESKNLYQILKNELSNNSLSDKNINESLNRTVMKSPSTGSAVNLIESKTYENPQFLRMKDLMGKIK